MLKVGKITAVNGLKGAVVLRQVINSTGWLKTGDTLFIELKRESLIPYFVESANASGADEYLVIFEDVESSEEARTILNKTVYVKEDVLEDAKVESPLMYIGYNLVDKEKGGLGHIEDVMLMGKQWIAQLTIQDKEVLIPLAEDLILDVNKKNKFIRMDLPVGLVDVYLGDENEN